MALTTELAHGTAGERAAADRLVALVAGHELSKWLYQRRVLVDESAAAAFSHPVIKMPAAYMHPKLSDHVVLSLFVHEQMHWALNSFPAGRARAIDEVQLRYPNPPRRAGGGAKDARSTWLHLPVCALEFRALIELFGEVIARQLLERRRFYTWVYSQILDEWEWYEQYLARHGLEV